MQSTTTLPPEQVFLLIDGLNIVRRVYEANPAPDSQEKAQGAVRASLASFKRALSEHKPDFALAAFDYGGSTWRHDLYPLYRQKRKPMPQELREVIPQFRELLTDMGLQSLCIPGVEADDTLASAFFTWSKLGRGPAIVMSTDKDMAALVAHGARVRDHFKLEWRDESWILAKFGVPAAQLQDLLALAGDSSDDIPGVTKVGLKTAAGWLRTHGTLENVLAAADSIPGKLGDNLRAEVDIARLSRQLVGFKTDIPLGINLSSLRMREPVAA
jgi:protein Xni